MSKNLRTSNNYTIQAGTGAGGTSDIILDSRAVIVKGDLDIEGNNTVIDTTSLTIEDPILVLSRNNSTPSDIDAGIMINRGAANNAAIYWNEGDDKFKAVTTTSNGTGNSITDTALAKLQVGEPTASSDAATKNYVDSAAGAFSLNVAGDDSTAITVASGQLLQFVGGSGITTAGSEPDTITISLSNNLTDVNSIDTGSSNGDLILRANGTGNVVVDDTLTFSAMASDPTATAQTILYNKTAGGGGTGLYFRNSNIASGVVGELISKSKATALAIALG
tara:strand:+ start:562 stop:1395 length:834 start_codon:yes stop_codon:yes gene_type:complete